MKSRSRPFSAHSFNPRHIAAFFIISCAALALTFMGAESASATPLAIQILNGQYTTSISTWISSNGVPLSPSRTLTSQSPLSDELTVTGLSYGGADSRAQSGNFSVEAYAAVFGGTGSSLATNQISFSPLEDQTLTLSLLFSSQFRYYFCSGSIDLYDLTANAEVWNYGWNGFNGTVPWSVAPGGYGPSSAELDPVTTFLSSHTYELTMITGAGSASDTDEAMIQLQGLEVVPEPGFGSLLIICLGVLLVFRRKAFVKAARV